jgi:hypothetical protein
VLGILRVTACARHAHARVCHFTGLRWPQRPHLAAGGTTARGSRRHLTHLVTAQPLLKSANTRCIMQAHSATWKTTRDGGKQRCTPRAQKQCWLGDDSEGSLLTKNAQQCYGR